MSDSDSSDDDLLGTSVFTRKRKSRKETAKEVKETSLLDDLLNQQKERITKQSRIQEQIMKDREEHSISNGVLDSLNISPLFGGGAPRSTLDGQTANTPTTVDNTIPQAQAPSTIVKRYNIDDPSYWSNVEKYKQKGDGSDVYKPDQRKRIIDNVINGFDMKNEFGVDLAFAGIDGDNGRGSGDETFHSQEEREKRMAEIAGRHKNFGTRRTLGWLSQESENVDSKGESPFPPFESMEDAMDELNTLFNKYHCAPKRQLNSNGKERWNDIRENVIKPLKEANDLDILPHIMLAKKWKAGSSIPLDLLHWLIRVAVTGMMPVGIQLCQGAFSMLKTIFESRMDINNFNGNGTEAASEKLVLNDFPQLLKINYGLWQGDSTSAISPAVSDNGEQQKQECFNEPSGIKNAFDIFITAFRNDYVNIKPDETSTEALLSEIISMILRCGIDPVFYAGHSLLKSQGHLLRLLFQFAHRQLNGFSSKDGMVISEHFYKWIESTASLTMKTCCEQCMKLPKVEEEEDEEGWLLMDLVIRSWQTIDYKDEIMITFYSVLCKAALQKCVGDKCGDWNSKDHQVALAMMKEDMDEHDIDEFTTPPFRYKTIALAETAAGILISSSEIRDDDVRYFVTTRIIGICEQVGIELFMLHIQKAPTVSRNRGFCESDSEASLLYKHLERLCNAFQFLKKTTYSRTGHKRRAKELVILLLSLYDKCKKKVGSWDKRRKSNVRRQSDLSAWCAKPEEDDEEDEDGMLV